MSRQSVRRILYWLVIVLLWIASLGFAGAVGFEVGGRSGFQDAMLLTKYREDAISGRRVAEALRSIRVGDDDAAMDWLEGMVDGAALTYDAYVDLDLSRFEKPLNHADYQRIYSLGVGRYRSEFPSEFPNPDTRTSIERAVQRMAQSQARGD